MENNQKGIYSVNSINNGNSILFKWMSKKKKIRSHKNCLYNFKNVLND